MSFAILAGDASALADGVHDALTLIGFETVAMQDWTGDPADVLVTVTSQPGDRVSGLDARIVGVGLARLSEVVERFAAVAPAAYRDTASEWHAGASVIHIVDHPVGWAMPEDASFAILTDAIVAMTRVTAAQLAPRLRINAVVPSQPRGQRDSASQAARVKPTPRLDVHALALRPTLEHLVSMPAVTGQIVSLQSLSG